MVQPTYNSPLLYSNMIVLRFILRGTVASDSDPSFCTLIIKQRLVHMLGKITLESRLNLSQYELYNNMVAFGYWLRLIIPKRFLIIFVDGPCDGTGRWNPSAGKTRSKESYIVNTWWRHQMETFSALLVICAENSTVIGEFPAQRPVTRSFDVFFDLRQNIRLRQQWWGWWFETLSRLLWRHCNDNGC